MTVLEAGGLALAAAAGGAINAVAGGGTIVTFPTLLAFGMPPVTANATSTLALMLGTSGSLYGYRAHMEPVRPWLKRFLPVSLVGGLLGAVLLRYTTNETFGKLVPFLILFATLLFIGHGVAARLRQGAGPAAPEGARLWWTVVFQFAVAVYGGYFGAGIGILMLAALGFVGLRNIHEMNALKTILGSSINAVASLWFILSGLISWPQAAVMTFAAIGGYYLASHYSQSIPQARVRQIIAAIGLILSAVTFYAQFVPKSGD
jgi:uncharacterized membrane protein YfcA